MADHLVTVASFYSPIEANLFKMRLEENGIQAGLMGEGTVAVLGIYSGFGNRIEVQVNEWDADMAVRLLEQFESESKQPGDEELPSVEADEAPSDAIRPRQHRDEQSTQIRSAEPAPLVDQRDDVDKVRGTKEPTVDEHTYQTCPECQSKVDIGRDVCHWCGTPMTTVVEEKSAETPEDDPVVDDALLKSLETAEGDARIHRAFLLATGGFVISGLAAFLLFVLSGILGPGPIIMGFFVLPVCHVISLVLVLLAHGH